MTLYSILSFIAIIPVLISSILVYKNYKRDGGKELFLYTVTIIIWVFTAGLEDCMGNLASIKTVAKFGYLGYVFNPFLLLFFLFKFSGIKKEISKTVYISVFIFPIVMLLAAFTNDFHLLVWKSITIGEGNSCHFSHGPLFFIFNILVFISTLLSISLVVMLLFNEKRVRTQGWVMMIGFSFQWWAGLLYITGWSPFKGYDIVAISGVFPALSISH